MISYLLQREIFFLIVFNVVFGFGIPGCARFMQSVISLLFEAVHTFDLYLRLLANAFHRSESRDAINKARRTDARGRAKVLFK